MELDYFTLYLRRYMREHLFDQEDINSEKVKDNSEAAWMTWEAERKAGNSDIGATELAEQDLFVGIGLSREEAAQEMLEEYFSDRIQIDEPLVYNFWTQRLKEANSIWESFHVEGELGLNEELVEEGKGKLITRIDQFLKDHGL